MQNRDATPPASGDARCTWGTEVRFGHRIVVYSRRVPQTSGVRHLRGRRIPPTVVVTAAP
jgi:hypothetical protein